MEEGPQVLRRRKLAREAAVVHGGYRVRRRLWRHRAARNIEVHAGPRTDEGHTEGQPSLGAARHQIRIRHRRAAGPQGTINGTLMPSAPQPRTALPVLIALSV